MMKKTQRPISLRHFVENSLREAIVEGQLKPGERLYEHELCDMLGVSRPLVREAIRKLEAEKLVTVVPHKGPVIAELKKEEAIELYAVRKLIESYAIHEFTTNATKENLSKLQMAIADLHKASTNNNERNLLLKAKNNFYDVILNGCKNELVKEIFKNLLARVSLLRSISFSQPGRLYTSLAEIDEIYQYIENRDANAAEEASRKHVENAESAALEVMEQIEHEKGSPVSKSNRKQGAINEQRTI